MAVTQITVPVAGIDSILGSYDRVIVYVSKTGAAGPYIETTTPATRPVLTAGSSVYTYTDPAGDPSYFYSAAFYNSLTQATSPMSTPLPATGDAALSLMSVQQFKDRFLAGLPTVDAGGNPLPDELYTFALASAVGNAERNLDIAILPRVITDEKHTYFEPNSRSQPLRFRTNLCPVLSVDAVRIMFPFMQAPVPLPGDQVIWQAGNGSITLFLRYGVSTFVAGGLTSFALGVINNMSTCPEVFRVDYQAGFPAGQVPAELVNYVGMMAAFPVLETLGDLINGPGIASSSFGVDGLSQSISAGGYGARLQIFAGQIEAATKQLRLAYRGISVQGG